MMQRIRETLNGGFRSAGHDAEDGRVIDEGSATKECLMKHALICSTLSIGLLAGVALGAKRDPDVDKALKSVYPDARTEITGSQVVNGVKVQNVKVTTKDGESEAAVTENGDFLYYGTPRKNISPSIAKNIGGLFKGVGKDMDVFWATNYLVDITAPSNKEYRLRFDATGRLKDIQNAAEVKRESEQKGSAAKDSDKIKSMASKYMDGAKVSNVYADADQDGFYTAEVTTKDGEPAIIRLNNDGQVYMKRWEIKNEDIPEPALKTLDEMFDKSKLKVTKAYRSDFEYYQFDSQTSAGDQVVVRLRPNGDIMSVTNAKAAAEEEAVTAKAKQGASSSKKKAKNPG
jgi:hypothetical protein